MPRGDRSTILAQGVWLTPGDAAEAYQFPPDVAASLREEQAGRLGPGVDLPRVVRADRDRLDHPPGKSCGLPGLSTVVRAQHPRSLRARIDHRRLRWVNGQAAQVVTPEQKLNRPVAVCVAGDAGQAIPGVGDECTRAQRDSLASSILPCVEFRAQLACLSLAGLTKGKNTSRSVQRGYRTGTGGWPTVTNSASHGARRSSDMQLQIG